MVGGCLAVVAQWQSIGTSSQMCPVLPVTAGLFYFRLIESKFLYIQHEARTLNSYILLGLVPRLPHGVCV